ncbi:MAG: penicillin-binding protein 2 [Opitutaceae bacterium]|nr:penicillin-binding protein 2 [Opitutaceae bacterium]
MARGFASNYRIVLLGAVVTAAFLGIAMRLVDLHVIDRERLTRYVDKARRQVVVEKARRGDILDSRGQILATSRPLIVIGVDPQVARPEDEARWPDLARLLKLPYPQVAAAFRTRNRVVSRLAEVAARAGGDEYGGDATDDPEGTEVRWVKLSDTVDEPTYDRIMELGIKGVYAPPKSYTRAYPNNDLAAHVIGFVNKEHVAVQGVERWADFYLRGQDGWRESEKDGKRRELPQFRTREVPAAQGYTVVLSLDSFVQHLAEEELAHITASYHPIKATIIVSDANTGFILAMANSPTFNLNEYNKLSGDELKCLRNIAVADILEPGSTFKIVAASGALNDRKVNLTQSFDCSLERIDYRGKSLDMPGEAHRFDHPLTLSEIVSHSSNKGAAQLGMLLGEQRMWEYARAFGFGEYTGFPSLYPESPGMLANYTKWRGTDITRIPMGHGIAATPLQIHYAMGVIASGGELLRPQIVREVRDARGEVLYTFVKSVRRRVIEAGTAKTVAQMLHRVTLPGEGTAQDAAIPQFEVAGKTGTTQKLIDGHYSTQHHIGSFVGFFPASRPEVVISVFVDDGQMPPGKLNYGSAVAVPSFRRIGEKLAQYLRITPVAASPVRSLLALEGGHR